MDEIAERKVSGKAPFVRRTMATMTFTKKEPPEGYWFSGRRLTIRPLV